MVALMSGVPLQSAHFDSTSAPSVLPAASQTSFQLAINPAFAALENLANAAALAVLATHDLELQAGGAVFDNTATDYSARVADEQFAWSSALSGVSGTQGLLSVLAASPRAKADPAALAKMKDVLTTLPNAKHIIVVAINDEGIQGAFSAAKAVGRQDDIYAGSQGAAASAHCDILKNSHWIGATAYFPERYGEIGVPYLIDLIKGKKVPFQLKIKHVAVDATNIKSLFPKDDWTKC